jgi:hypothetical protein
MVPGMIEVELAIVAYFVPLVVREVSVSPPGIVRVVATVEDELGELPNVFTPETVYAYDMPGVKPSKDTGLDKETIVLDVPEVGVAVTV